VPCGWWAFAFSFRPSIHTTATAFWNAVEDKSAGEAVVKARIKDNWVAIKSAVAESGIADSKEFAMFIANVMQETGEMTTKTESTSHYTSNNYDWGECAVDAPVKGADLKDTDKCTKQYFGRGYLQTTWHKNYKEIVDAGKCNKDRYGKPVDIVVNPEKVATDETLAWCTAAYYWKNSVHDDRCKNGCDMGNTIDAINGPLECHDDHPEHAQRRFCFYKNFYESYASTTVYWHDKVCVKDLDAKCPVR